MQALAVTWRKLTKSAFDTGTIKVGRFVKVAFSNKYLLLTNVTISITLSTVGDFAEQQYEIYKKELEQIDRTRSIQMAVSGSSVGVLCHYWYKVLDKFIIGKTFDMVAKKLVLDQFLFSPVMILTFFGTLAFFEKEPLENFKEEVKDKFVRLYKAEWMVWPPAQIINFYFLPTRYRVLYDNTISLGYDVYTSQVKHDKSMKTYHTVVGKSQPDGHLGLGPNKTEISKPVDSIGSPRTGKVLDQSNSTPMTS